MPQLRLGLVLHNHQPVGNYGFVFGDLYDAAYLPMLEALERHPGIRFALHTSGPLIDWMQANKPQYIERLRALCDRGQAEIVSGGYYEPILPMIPDADKAGQIAKMSRFIEDRFGQRPSGLWLTERVWEPGLPAPLADAGVRWTLVDDEHFRTAGIEAGALDGYYITEDQGKRIAIFPGSQRLRYTIPWLDVPDLLRELREMAERTPHDDAYIVLGDDGEKFGGWPTTYDHVWAGGWIDRFFAAVEENADWLETMTPGAYFDRFAARGLVYLPAASYAEMMEWALPTGAAIAYGHVLRGLQQDRREDVLPFVRGGFWRAFLAKYPEANAMHKRGLRIDAKLARVDDAGARDALWQAQCNCPYWHGVFGGLYLRNIRAATTSNLVRAERLADAAAHDNGPVVTSRDFDFDGRDELLVQTPALSMLLHPLSGGMLSELDLRLRDHALLDVVARRPEPYHDALREGRASNAPEDVTSIHSAIRIKEEGLEHAISYDRHRRGALQEWIINADATPEWFARGEIDASCEPEGAWGVAHTIDDGGATVRLTRDHAGLRVEKTLHLPAADEAFAVSYTITNTGGEHRCAMFVSQWNVSAPQIAGGDDRIARIESAAGECDLTGPPGAVEAAGFVLRGSAGFGIACDIDDAQARVWHAAVESVSSSEGGLERVYQGASIAIVRALDLAAGASASLRLDWRVVDVAPAAAFAG